MEYTKGEWKVDYKGSIGHIKAVLGDITPTVCRYSPPPNCATYIPEEEQRANAQLIASAPDLYEACKMIVRGERRDGNYNRYDGEAFIKIAQQALAKAEVNNETISDL